ncbi:LOG family protein [Nocardia sp. alder85J]|uniref:SLOG cluster 4 domain-containing protein n=1 Tax=Nocardia sp. alder85J TaxID=2862949 RepID=UPI001CD7E146|nr:LOG family protein [Nocardia sp. alder85J]MCX4098888.1 LOG family protein [Nocardia sp. alder85J]
MTAVPTATPDLAPSRPQIAVCGPRDCTAAESDRAREVGRLLAEAGAVVFCGGGAGVMAAVAEGASGAGGFVVGIRPDADRGAVCPGLSAVVYTNLGEARNAVLVASADAVIVIGGSWGTLSELALARHRELPVVSLGGWSILDATGTPVEAALVAPTPRAAVDLALGRPGGRAT